MLRGRQLLFIALAVLPALSAACAGDDTLGDDDASGKDASAGPDASVDSPALDSALHDATNDRTLTDSTILDAFVGLDATDATLNDASNLLDAESTDLSDAADADVDAADAAVMACVPIPAHQSGTIFANEQVDAIHAGYQPLDQLSLPLCQRWSIDFGDGTRVTSPIVVDANFVYANVAGSGPNVGIYGILPQGTKIWGPVSGISGESFSSIAYDALQIYAISQADRLYAFGFDGGFRWVRSLSQFFKGSKITTKDGLVYVMGAENGANLYVVDKNGNLVWTSPLLNNATAGAPTVSDTTVFLDLGCNQISAMDRFDGGFIWSTTPPCTGGENVTMPLLGSKLYSIAEDRVFPAVVLNAADGSDAGTFSSTIPPAWNGTNIFVTGQTSVSAIDATSGAVVWTYTSTRVIGSPPLVVGANVVVATIIGQVIVLDSATGNLVSTAQAPQTLSFLPNNFEENSLAVANGQLYIPTDRGLTAF